MKIDFNNPPEWLNCGCFECMAIKRSVSGSALIPACTNCGEILVKNDNGLPEVLEDCPSCTKGEQSVVYN